MNSTTSGKAVLSFLVLAIIFIFSCSERPTSGDEGMIRVIEIDSKRAVSDAANIRNEVSVELEEGLELSLWASDSLVNAPIAISIDANGKVYYTKAIRQSNSEFDIRGHRNWMTASISFETVEDRRKFLRETFAAGSEESEKFLKDLNNDGVKDWRDLTVEKEEVWWIQDTNEDGYAEKAQLFIKDFHEEITDVANGIEVDGDDVYVSVAPDLWRIKDVDKDGFADEKTSISHGYGIHIGFSGHGMSGVIKGPDGRIYWGIGDIGMNLTDKEGKEWKYPNQGVIVRSEPDGSNFEVYAAGVRNTHEFVFDKYGNLITEDNDGDHRGERERLIYVINGSDSGWRSNWQYGKYTDPANNDYKVWMDERLSVPKWDNQAAYIIPPIQNYVNGPTGMLYNPGTALGEEWYDHFFIAEFRGTPANSPIHAFTLKPSGAGFELNDTKAIASGLLPTGMDFGPDGALYFADWIDGWNPQEKGRIWKLDVPGGSQSAIRMETKKLIQTNFDSLLTAELSGYLGHQDMRIRSKAQFALVKKGDEGIAIFKNNLTDDKDQMTRIHSIWGLGQAARSNLSLAYELVGFVNDKDAEIRAQVVKMLGDVKYVDAGAVIVPLLDDESLRVQMLAAEALGRMEYESANEGLKALLIRNNNDDVYLRHAASLALAKIGDADFIATFSNHPSKALRLAGVVALRRMQSDAVKVFLSDKDEWVVTEAARAIHDDWSIMGAMPELASILNSTSFKNEALLRRVINANFRLGEKKNIDELIAFINNAQAPANMRAEAMACLGTWANPSVLDRVDGRNRNLQPRDGTYAGVELSKIIDNLATTAPAELTIAMIKAIDQLKLNDKAVIVETLFYNSGAAKVKEEALKALSNMNFKQIDQLLEAALSDKDEDLRSTALSLIPESSLDETKAVALFEKIIEEGTIIEKQTAFAALAGYQSAAAKNVISEYVSRLQQGDVMPEIGLDILEAAITNGDPAFESLIQSYYRSKGSDNDLAEYEESLYGGDPQKGRNIFFRNEAAQCVRCHSIFEWGGDAGPGLQGIASKLTDRQLLEALILPSKRLAPGYGVLSVELNDGTSVVGILERETDDELILRVSKDENKSISKAMVTSQSFVPSSMPAVTNILNKKEIRDLVSFLSSLKSEEEI